jgi:hypothetical protein
MAVMWIKQLMVAVLEVKLVMAQQVENLTALLELLILAAAGEGLQVADNHMPTVVLVALELSLFPIHQQTPI